MDSIRSLHDRWLRTSPPGKIKVLRAISLVSFFLFFFILVVYVFSETRSISKPIPKVVIFMDAMPYNLEVIRYYAQRRDLEISMIVLTLSGWVGNLNAAYTNVAAFLKLLSNEGYSKEIPLYYGNSVPASDLDFFEIFNVSSTQQDSDLTLCRFRRFLPDSLVLNAELMFGVSSYLREVDMRNVTARPSFFARPLSALLSQQEVRFLVLGPCTDASWFLQSFTEHRSKVSSIVVAGGNFLGSGDVQPILMKNQSIEINFFFDPVAANYIMQGEHGRPVTLIPFDVTIPWKSSVYDVIVGEKVGDTALSTAMVVAKALYGYYSFHEYYSFHVPLSLLAAAFMADPYLQEGAPGLFIPVQVRLGDGEALGGLSFRPVRGKFDVKVVTGMDASTFFEHLTNVNYLAFR